VTPSDALAGIQNAATLKRRRLSFFSFLCLYVVAIAVPAAAAGNAAAAKRIIVLYSSNRLSPTNVEVDRGLKLALTRHRTEAIRMSSEFLDTPEDDANVHEELLVSYLHDRYVALQPDVMVVVSDGA